MPMNPVIGISDDVQEVLRNSEITERTLKLPPGLDRQLYLKVNKILIAAGGRWVRKEGAHVFDNDPRQTLGGALNTGKIIDRKKALQAYYTPYGLAVDVVSHANITSADSILEPSIGEGALALAALEYFPARLTGYDIDKRAVEKATDALAADPLSRNVKIRVAACDFLKVKPSTKYTRVVMNPPFTKHQDIQHVTHALKFLKPSGRLVAIMSPTWQSATIKKCKTFRSLLDSMEKWLTIPNNAGAFKESGTGVHTVTLVVDAPGNGGHTAAAVEDTCDSVVQHGRHKWAIKRKKIVCEACGKHRPRTARERELLKNGS